MLATHLRRHRGLQVGEETTEFLKTTFASTFLPDDISRSIEVRGRDVQTGSPGAVEVTTGEIYPIVESIVRRIAQLVKDTLTELRPEVAADIYDRGVMFTGGGALLEGIDQYMRSFINLPSRSPTSRATQRSMASSKCSTTPSFSNGSARNELGVLQNAEIPFEA